MTIKISAQTDRYLELTNQNRHCLWGLLSAIPFVIGGLIATVATTKVTTLTCQRNPGNQIDCHRTSTGMLGTEKDLILGQLRSVKTLRTGKNSRAVILETSAGDVKLAPDRSIATDSQDLIAAQLNTFLQDPQQATIRVEQDDRWPNLILNSNFVIGGVVIALYALSIPTQMSCKLDRNGDRVTIDKKYWLYGDRQTVLPLSKIERARVRRIFLYQSSDRQPLYTIDLIPINARKVSLLVSMKDLTECQRLVDVIDRLLPHHQGVSDRSS